MSLNFGFFNSEIVGGVPDRVYSADDMNGILKGIVSDGICDIDNKFDVDMNSGNPKKMDVKSGRGIIKNHWFYDSGTTLDKEFTNSAANTKYYAICIEIDSEYRTIRYVVRENVGSIPTEIKKDTDSLSRFGIAMVEQPAGAEDLSESNYYSLIGTPPSGSEHPEIYTPYITFLGHDGSSGDYVPDTKEGISSALLKLDKLPGGNILDDHYILTSVPVSSSFTNSFKKASVLFAYIKYKLQEVATNLSDIFTFNRDIHIGKYSTGDSDYTNANIVFDRVQGSCGSIIGAESPQTGAGMLSIKNVKLPEGNYDAVPKKYVDDTLDNNIFVATFDGTTCDKTRQEVLDAYNDGKIMLAKIYWAAGNCYVKTTNFVNIPNGQYLGWFCLAGPNFYGPYGNLVAGFSSDSVINPRYTAFTE